MSAALLKLSHAALWQSRACLVTVGLDTDGAARAAKVDTLRDDFLPADLAAAVRVLDRWMEEGLRLSEAKRRLRGDNPALTWLVDQALRVEAQAGPIVMFAHRAAAEAAKSLSRAEARE